MTYAELVALARQLEGETLRTVTGTAFTVGVYLDCPFFTPSSTGLDRCDGRKACSLREVGLPPPRYRRTRRSLTVAGSSGA